MNPRKRALQEIYDEAISRGLDPTNYTEEALKKKVRIYKGGSMTKEFDEPQWPRLIASEPRQVTEAQEDVANAFSTAKNAIIECERARRCQEYAIQQFEAAIGTLRDLMYLKNS